MSAATDPRERIRCSCPRIDGKDCIRVRCNDDLRIMTDVEPSKLICDDDDECPCACHEIYEAELVDEVADAPPEGVTPGTPPAPPPVEPVKTRLSTACAMELHDDTGPRSALEAIRARREPEPWRPSIGPIIGVDINSEGD